MQVLTLVVLAITSFGVATTPTGLKTTGKFPGEVTVTIAAECNAFACVSAYAGEIAACAAAAAEAGLNPIADIACFAALAGAEAVGPVCAACF